MHTPPPNLRGILIISKTLPVPVSTPLPFSPSHESLPFGEHQSAKCRNLGQRHSLETCSGWWPRQLSRPDPPHGVTGRISRRSGLRGSRGPWARPARALSAEAGERLEGREDGWMFVHGMDGRAVQQAGSVFTVQWLPSGWGASVRPPEEPWQVPEGRQGRARPGLRLGTWSQAGAESAGRGRLGERSPAGLLLPSSGLHTFPGNPAAAGPPCESHASLSGTSPFLLGSIPCRDPSLGTKLVLWARGLFHSSAPTLLSTSTGLWVPGPGAGLAGGRRREQPLRGRGC